MLLAISPSRWKITGFKASNQITLKPNVIGFSLLFWSSNDFLRGHHIFLAKQLSSRPSKNYKTSSPPTELGE